MDEGLPINKRIRSNYNLKDQDVMKLRKQNVLNEIEILRLTGVSVIYDNQEIIASKVCTGFKDRRIVNIMVISRTQSGKTGSMCATIKQYLEDTSNLIPIENIYIITGVSSCEWKEQTKKRMPESLQKRVFHRCELPSTFKDEIRNKKNVLIIMDEIQVAAKKGQTIYNTFLNAGLLNKTTLYTNDVKILEYTATPDGTIYDLMKWNDASSKILADVGDGYISSYDLLQQGRVRQCKELCGYDEKTGQIDNVVFENIREIKRDIDNYTKPLYHIIRTRHGKGHQLTITNFKTVFDPDHFQYIQYTKESEIDDINKTLEVEPVVHTLIFIKEKLRCSKTLYKKYNGVLYERYSKNPDDAAIIQGLIGRDTGYDNNGLSICYTNLESIVKYEELWRSNFEHQNIKWNSKTTMYIGGVLSGKSTFNNPDEYEGFSDYSTDSVQDEEPQPIIKLKTFGDIKVWFNSNLKEKGYGKGPKQRTADDDGFFKCITQFDKVEKIRSTQEFEKYEHNKQWGFRGMTEKSRQKNKYRVYPVYNDIGDKDSLEWWLVYY
jgi:hypothetical protein